MKNSIIVAIIIVMLFSVLPVPNNFALTVEDTDEVCDCGVSVMNVSSDSNLYLTEYYSTYYFNNLNQNFGNNTHGSCGYVAMAMLLSYYDTYWEDTFINDAYDVVTSCSSTNELLSVESPGIRRESSQMKSLDSSSYLSAVQAQSDIYFHLKLIKIGYDLGYYDVTQESPGGLNPTELWQVLDCYLYDYLGLSSLEVSVETQSTTLTSTEQQVREFAISKIQQGIPVLMSIRNTSGTGGHVVVAYDYDASNDEIYVHTGWSGNKSHVKLSDLAEDSSYQFTRIRYATALNVNIQHVCSNNFVFTDSSGNTTTPCLCQKLAIHPEHEHSLSYTTTDSTHTITCEKCGYTSGEVSHTLHYFNNGVDSGHTVDCSGCNYTCTEAHTWIAVGTKFRCGRCAALTTAIPTPFASLPPEILVKIEQLGVGDFAMDIGDGTVLCRIGDQYYLVAGQTEDTAPSYLQNELSVITPDREAA